MYKQYLKQAWASLLENPLMSVLMIMGTTLSAAMLLVLVQFYIVRTSSYAPVSARGRMLYVTGVQSDMVKVDSDGRKVSTGGRWMDGLGVPFVRQVFEELKTVEEVAVMSGGTGQVRLSSLGRKKGGEFAQRKTNGDFWRVFDFVFVAGKPYDEASVRSARRQAVLTEDVARELFGATEVIGETLLIEYVEYQVCGIVKPISEAVSEVYGQVFVPYTCDEVMMAEVNAGGVCGGLNVCLLATSAADFPVIREEVARNVRRYKSNLQDWKANLFAQPHTATQQMFQRWYEEKLSALFSGMLCLALLFFFLPVFNMLGLAFSQIRRRQPEIGLRKAFGATSSRVVGQMLCESLIVTVIGCVLGQCFSVLFFFLAKDGLLERTDVQLTADMLFTPWLFPVAFLICLFINFLSIGIPAWRIARRQIVEALNA